MNYSSIHSRYCHYDRRAELILLLYEQWRQPDTNPGYSLYNVKLSNMFLTFVNRSFVSIIYYTTRYKKINWLQLFSLFLRFSRPPFILFLLCANCINWRPLPRVRFWLCFGITFASFIWIELYKSDFLKL